MSIIMSIFRGIQCHPLSRRDWELRYVQRRQPQFWNRAFSGQLFVRLAAIWAQSPEIERGLAHFEARRHIRHLRDVLPIERHVVHPSAVPAKEMRVGRDVAVVAGTLLVNRYLQGRSLLDKQAQRVVNGGLGERWNFLNNIVVDFVHRRVCAMSHRVFITAIRCIDGLTPCWAK